MVTWYQEYKGQNSNRNVSTSFLSFTGYVIDDGRKQAIETEVKHRFHMENKSVKVPNVCTPLNQKPE